MKKINITYWILTGLFAAFMLSSAIPDALATQDAVTFMTTHLGYPVYLVSFIGIAKILGVIGILIPDFPRVTEWAYAGLFFDLAGATYSIVALEGMEPGIAFMAVVIALGAASYIYYHKRLAAKALAHKA